MRSISDFYPTTIEEEQKMLLMPFVDKKGAEDELLIGGEGCPARRTISTDDLDVRLFYKAIDLSG